MNIDLKSPAAKVGIIGRPNVGKSSLFNVLVRKRKSLVRNQPGVTRDILVEPTEWWGKAFDVVDTGGLTEAKDRISQLIREQTTGLISDLDLLVVVMDAKTGLMPEDSDVVRLAKESGRPFVLIVNKVDNFDKKDLLLSEFYEFGEPLIPCSFENREGVDQIVEWIKAHLPEKAESECTGVRLAIVGKPNAGKSSLCNTLLSQKRMLVSDIPGTTMDSVEVGFNYGGRDYVLVDTAGLRRRSRRQEGLERLAAVKSHDSIDRADIVLLMVDLLQGISLQEARLVEYILGRHKPVVLVANKVDLAKKEQESFRKKFRNDLSKVMHFYSDIPLVFVSAKTGTGLKELFVHVEDLWEKLHKRISTSKLNNFFYKVIRMAPAPVAGTENVKFYYLTQTHQTPPSFIAFANRPEGVTPSYRRFLAKHIQKEFGLEGVPIRIFVMGGKS